MKDVFRGLGSCPSGPPLADTSGTGEHCGVGSAEGFAKGSRVLSQKTFMPVGNLEANPPAEV